mmetsp:Transcript_8841/g.16903  ORF Transcript_8841/g.16903 Transcript_8841/m.16903 type:complete len:190 (-) Transcript_8841:126-695(-)
MRRKNLKTCLIMTIFSFVSVYLRYQQKYSSRSDLSWTPHHRRLAESGTCNGGIHAYKGLAVMVYLILMLMLFVGIFVLVERYLMHAMELLCVKLKLSEDVAGATFMAIGSSFPELLAGFFDTFIFKDNIGTGTILGSAVFNILVGVGVASMVVKDDLKVHWRPVLRDLLFYMVAVLMCVLIFQDLQVEW